MWLVPRLLLGVWRGISPPRTGETGYHVGSEEGEPLMSTLEFVCELNVPLERVWEFHNDVAPLFKQMFAYRHRVTREALAGVGSASGLERQR